MILATLLMLAARSIATAQGLAGTPDSVSLGWARRLMHAMHSEQAVVRGIDAAMANQRQVAMGQLPPVFFDSIASKLRQRAPDIIDSLAPSYARSLSVPELKDLVKFYEGPLGQRLADAQVTASLESTQI